MGYQPFSAHAWEALIMKHSDIPQQYLPDDYSLEWQSALQGAVIGNRISVGKNQAGWMGDMPALTTIAQTETPASLVGLANWSRGQQCNLLVVPKDSDIEKTSDIAGETVGVTVGACSHRYLLRVLEEEGIDVTIEDTGISTILANLREGRIAAGVGWEPSIAKSVFQDDLTRYVSTGAEYDVIDAGGIPMTDDLINNHREAAKGILKAELEATRVLATDHERTLDLVEQEQDLRYFNRSTLRWGVYKDPPIGENVQRLRYATDYEQATEPGRLMKETAPEFLTRQGALEAPPPDDRYKPELLNEAAAELDDAVEWSPRSAGNGSGATNGSATGNASGSGR
ncbi:nitrate/sulfonate/bicarbonate ABC transporter periplasmic component-like protein [Halococcus saccharolyticus DSM 5350]|uniref:Nitrate/sulfonate/bicarbonate ABC transporter periplasmic component-like protein n=2 Tax=Halococcus saccharolyticus TaxID=62319 RepID=M0MM21_9EURY|nr:ABC transporter substrate-binding protein [Halococcus saccharolyticus]EMA46737.1 nitrate/sulfonate/bicarbonate ABC transporter periplasmic component-like protein [Halococcus saccharolyticus DSM 5350]